MGVGFEVFFSSFPQRHADFLLPARCNTLKFQYHICLHATMLSFVIVIDGTFEIVSKPLQLNDFLIRVAMVMVSVHAILNLKTSTFAVELNFQT